MKLKFLLGGLSALVAVGGIANLAQAQSSIGTVTPNSDAVLTIDQTDALSGSTTDPLALRGMQAHTATPTNVLVMEGEMVRSYPIASITGSGTSDSLEANPDGSYTHTDAAGNVVTIAAPSDPIEPFVQLDDPTTQADLGDGSVLLPRPSGTDITDLNIGGDVRDTVEASLRIRTVNAANDNRGAYIDFAQGPLAARAQQGVGRVLELDEAGQLKLNIYGDGTFDDANPARVLGVNADGDVIEVDPSTLEGGTSTLTAKADGSFDHNDGNGNITTIPAPATDKVENNGNGTYTHTAVNGSQVTWNGQGPVGVWLDSTDMTRADLNDKSIFLPPNPANANPHIAMHLLGLQGSGERGASVAVNNDEVRWQANNDSYLFRMAATPADTHVDTFEMRGNGRLFAHQYGDGNFNNGNEAYILGVTAGGLIVEVDPATVGGGSGATSTLTAKADGSFDHDDGTGNVTTIPAPAAAVTSSLTTTGGGIYEHSDGAATPTTLSFDTSNAWHPASDVTATASAVGSTAEDIWFDAGQVGIGVVPSEMLHVAGNALLTGNLYTNSDSRLKTNIVEFEGSLASVMNIEPVTFDWIDEDAHTSGTQLGFIAQDVQAALPEAVIVSEDELGTLSVADRPILAASIGAIQELKAENDALKAELEDMKSQMQQMELLQLAVMSMQAQLADMAQADAMMKANFSL